MLRADEDSDGQKEDSMVRQRSSMSRMDAAWLELGDAFIVY